MTLSGPLRRALGLGERVRRRVSPFREVMDTRDYRRVVQTPPLSTATTRMFGRPLAFSDKTGLLHSIREIFYDEVYKFETRVQAPHIIDAGANIGLSVIYFKRRHPQCSIIAYEPDAAIFALLQRNAASYEHVELRNAAAWTEDGKLEFYSEGSLAGSSEMDFSGAGRRSTVRSERLRDRIEERRVDFLKIDIEGAENSVLPDIAPVLGNVDRLFFEYHSVPGDGQRLGELLNLVSNAGFRYTINGAHGATHPFVETVAKGFDLQLNVSCVRPSA